MNGTPHTAFERFLATLVGGAYRWAWPVVFAAVLLTAGLTVYAARNIAVHTDTNEMIDPTLPYRVAFRTFNETFPQVSDTFVVVIRSTIPEAADAVRARVVTALTADRDHFSSVYAPGFGPYFDRTGMLFLDDDELDRVADRLAAAEPVLAAMVEDPTLARFFDLLRQGVEDELDGEAGVGPKTLDVAFDALTPVIADGGGARPLSWSKMFDPDSRADDAVERFVVVQPRLDTSTLSPAKAALSAARAVAEAALGAEAGVVDIAFTGKIALNAEELKSVSDGAAIAGLLSMALVALILGFGLRSAKLVFATLLTLAMGLVWTAAFAIFAIGYLNIISVAFAVLFIGLGIDFGVHFALRFAEETTAGADPATALRRTAGGTGAALALCAPTTALAFFAFAPTAYVGLSQLGIISGTGIFISLFASLTVLPALIRILPGKVRAVGNGGAGRWQAVIERRGKVVALAGIAIGIAAAAVAPGIRFDADPIRLKDPRAPSVEAYYRIIQNKDAAPYAVEVLADSDAEVERLAADLKALPEVERVVRLASFVPKDQERKLSQIDDLAVLMTPVLIGDARAPGRSTPADKTALGRFAEVVLRYASTQPDGAPAQRLAHELGHYISESGLAPAALDRLGAAIFRYWPRAMAALKDSMDASPVTVADVPPEIAARYRAGDGTRRLEVSPSADLSDPEKLATFVAAVKTVAPGATGGPVQIAGASAVVKEAMLEATGLAALLVSVFLLATLRDLRRVGLVLLPIAIAGALTLAASVLLPLPFNFANVIVLPLLIGLGVDSGIHLVERAHEGEGGAVLATSTPRAVVLSALTTLASFGTLAVSPHRGTASMGEFLVVAIFFTLVCTLVVLPGMIAALERRAT